MGLIRKATSISTGGHGVKYTSRREAQTSAAQAQAKVAREQAKLLKAQRRELRRSGREDRATRREEHSDGAAGRRAVLEQRLEDAKIRKAVAVADAETRKALRQPGPDAPAEAEAVPAGPAKLRACDMTFRQITAANKMIRQARQAGVKLALPDAYAYVRAGHVTFADATAPRDEAVGPGI